MSVKEVGLIDDAVREQYDKAFDSEWYFNLFYRKPSLCEENSLRRIYDIFQQEKLEGPIKRCIDIGCGPVVNHLSAASKVCDTLVYSDFSANNRKMVQDWIDRPGSDPAYLSVFKICANLEGFDDLEKGAHLIENRIKSKVEGVKNINVLSPEPLGQLDEPFDLAFSFSCLEAACDSYESYMTGVRNIATMIRPKGYLVLQTFLGITHYDVNGVDFPVLSLTEDKVKKALQEGGFDIIESNTMQMPEEGCSDVSASGIILARKL